MSLTLHASEPEMTATTPATFCGRTVDRSSSDGRTIAVRRLWFDFPWTSSDSTTEWNFAGCFRFGRVHFHFDTRPVCIHTGGRQAKDNRLWEAFHGSPRIDAGTFRYRAGIHLRECTKKEGENEGIEHMKTDGNGKKKRRTS